VESCTSQATSIEREWECKRIAFFRYYKPPWIEQWQMLKRKEKDNETGGKPTWASKDLQRNTGPPKKAIQFGEASGMEIRHTHTKKKILKWKIKSSLVFGEHFACILVMQYRHSRTPINDV